jgi:hypothetical protein
LANGDASLAKRIAELNDKFNKVNLVDDTSSDKHLKLENKQLKIRCVETKATPHRHECWFIVGADLIRD